jgi:S1-C subfamily serine protease
MQQLSVIVSTLFVMVSVQLASAQSPRDVVWVQIAARPTYDAALERVETFSETLPDVSGFALQGGWFAIALGPYTPTKAEDVLRSLKLQGRIPADSYIALSSAYGQQYWPPGADVLGLGSIAAISAPALSLPEAPAPQDVQAPLLQQPVADDETPAQARRGEAALSPEDKRALQRALKWAGVYNSAIDGAFGRGTRNAMAAWQATNGFESTGILTTAQREALLGQYNAILDGLEMQVVRDLEAGIEIRIPTGAVAFDRYDPPFAQYNATGDLPARVLLVSQAGDVRTLASLYEIMQTLRIVPTEGARRLNRTSFTLVGQAADFVSQTEVSLSDGEIKGFTLIWPSGDEARRARVLDEMRSSFVRRTGVIDPTRGLPEDQRVDLGEGLEVRKPILSRSGFYVDRQGTVVTLAQGVESCARITLDDLYEATISRVDPEGGIAVLQPDEALSPPAFAQFSPAVPRLQSEVAVAGYSFEGQLGAASMTFGTLDDDKGLSGEPELSRLSLPALPGDVGGPVFDGSGNVFGMLLPQPEGSRRLPDGVRFALTGEALSGALTRAGLPVRTGTQTAQLAPEDIADRGIGMTVLVSCWE